MWNYEQNIHPPAPLIDVVVYHPEDLARTARIRAKIDTAADISAIPTTLADQLRLPVAKRLMVKGYDDVHTSMFTYSVLFDVAHVRFGSIRVITIPGTYALLGRDVLNHFYIHLNGPELTFNLSITPI